jgi:hypothetical protein
VSWRLRVKFGLVELFVLQSRLADSSATPVKDPNVHRAISIAHLSADGRRVLEQQHWRAFSLTSADLLMEEFDKHNSF